MPNSRTYDPQLPSSKNEAQFKGALHAAYRNITDSEVVEVYAKIFAIIESDPRRYNLPYFLESIDDYDSFDEYKKLVNGFIPKGSRSRSRSRSRSLGGRSCKRSRRRSCKRSRRRSCKRSRRH
jgi:hypothetical protein